MNKKASLSKTANELWKYACVKKWGQICEGCGKPAIQIHHYIPKSRNGLLRFCVENGVLLCKSCHYIIHHTHNPPDAYRIIERIRKGRGKRWCEYIDKHEKIHGTSFRTIKWLNEQIENLKKQL